MLTFTKRRRTQAGTNAPFTVRAYKKKDSRSGFAIELSLSEGLLKESGWQRGDVCTVCYDDGQWFLERTLDRDAGYTVSWSGNNRTRGRGRIKLLAEEEHLAQIGVNLGEPRHCVVVEKTAHRITVRYQ